MEWNWKKRCKKNRKRKHEEIYGKPMCHLCDDCHVGKSKKHNGITYFCSITENDVGQSHFGLNSPKDCPKRKL